MQWKELKYNLTINGALIEDLPTIISTYGHTLFVESFTVQDYGSTYIVGQESHYENVTYQEDPLFVTSSKYSVFRFKDDFPPDDNGLYRMEWVADISAFIDSYVEGIEWDPGAIVTFNSIKSVWMANVRDHVVAVVILKFTQKKLTGHGCLHSFLLLDARAYTILYDPIAAGHYILWRYTWFGPYVYNIKCPISMSQERMRGASAQGVSVLFLYFKTSRKYKIGSEYATYPLIIGNPNWGPGFKFKHYYNKGIVAHYATGLVSYYQLNNLTYSDGCDFADGSEFYGGEIDATAPENDFYFYTTGKRYLYTDNLYLTGPHGYIDGHTIFSQVHQHRKETIVWDQKLSDQYNRIIRAKAAPICGSAIGVATEILDYDTLTIDRFKSYPMSMYTQVLEKFFAVVNDYAYIKPKQRTSWSTIKDNNLYMMNEQSPQWEDVEWEDLSPDAHILEFCNFNGAERSDRFAGLSFSYPATYVEQNDFILSFIKDGNYIHSYAGFQEPLLEIDPVLYTSPVGQLMHRGFVKASLKQLTKIQFKNTLIYLEGSREHYFCYNEKPSSLTITADNKIFIGGQVTISNDYFGVLTVPGVVTNDVEEMPFDRTGDYTTEIPWRRDITTVTGGAEEFTLVKNDGGAAFVHGNCSSSSPMLLEVAQVAASHKTDISEGVPLGDYVSVDYLPYPTMVINQTETTQIWQYDYEEWTQLHTGLENTTTACADLENNYYIGHNGTTPEIEKYDNVWTDFNNGLPLGVVITDIEGDFYNDR